MNRLKFQLENVLKLFLWCTIGMQYRLKN